jgi:hypothetical protein
MGIGSIVLGALSVLCMIGGVLATPIPFLGVMLSFLSPLLAMLGIVLGGVALSRSRSGGEESEGVAIGGLVTNIVVLVPSFLVAVTCGLCNTICTGIAMSPPHDSGPRAIFPDSGVHFPTGYPGGGYPPSYPYPYPPGSTPPPLPPPGTPLPPIPGLPPVMPTIPTPVVPGGPALPPPPLPPGPVGTSGTAPPTEPATAPSTAPAPTGP